MSLTGFFPVSRVPQVQQKKLQVKESPSRDGVMYFSVNGVSPQDLIKAGGKAKVIINDKEVALVYHNNNVYAVQEKCPHYGGPLHLGDIEEVPGCGPCIKCPWHKWTFSLTSGKCVVPQNRLEGRLETYPVQWNGKEIKIGFNEISPQAFVTPPD